ncbi:MAG: hypothetical protein KU37_02965 [Sulfuricurvum sp. PC08-66]|nr:MAG: hypothetical protein KU37_02965 [Sulfuricurvum sp. PC08-66]
MHILFTGGGTGGHLVIAKALKEEALALGHTASYIGSTYGQDVAWFGADETWSHKHFYATAGVVNKRGLAKLASLWAIGRAMLSSIGLLRRWRVDAVVNVGGYSAAPASIAAVVLRTPLYIHEQNATMGKLNAILRPYAKRFFSSYFENPCDYPVRDAFFTTKRLRKEVKTVLFLGGSQGASAINNLALTLAPWLKEHNIAIIHQAGEVHLASTQTAYDAMGIEAEVLGFYSDMPSLLARGDFAIARAGASSVWELTANGLPTLFIPYPHAALDHQTANAKAHVDAEAAWMMQENALDIEAIKALLLLDVSPQSQRLLEMLAPHGARSIIQTIKEENA